MIGQGIKRPGQGLKLVSLGCGQGNIERALLESNRPLEKMSCLEYDSALLEAARTRLAGFEVETEFSFFDFKKVSLKWLSIPDYSKAFQALTLHYLSTKRTLVPDSLNKNDHPQTSGFERLPK